MEVGKHVTFSALNKVQMADQCLKHLSGRMGFKPPTSIVRRKRFAIHLDYLPTTKYFNFKYQREKKMPLSTRGLGR